MAGTVWDVMASDPLMLPSTCSLQEAAAWLLWADAREVLVLDGRQRICGIVSDCEVAITAVSGARHPADITLGALLGSDPLTLSPSDAIEDAARRLRAAAVHHAPVVYEGRPVGVMSLGALVSNTAG
jgi:CBS domain-containing protein